MMVKRKPKPGNWGGDTGIDADFFARTDEKKRRKWEKEAGTTMFGGPSDY